jgi:hypothetical protein
MVNIYLLSLTLTTASLALAAPLPRDILERDLDEEFSGREYPSNAFDNLSAREPNFFGDVGKAFKGVEREAVKVGKVAADGLVVAGKIANNPMVQTASSFLPGGGGIVAAEKIVGAVGDKVGKMENMANKAGRALNKAKGALAKGKRVEKAIVRKVKGAERKVKGAERKLNNLKHPGRTLGKVQGKAVTRAKQAVKSVRHTAAARRHHRRELGDDEELSLRDLDAEELFEREYDDFLAERDSFDDLD